MSLVNDALNQLPDRTLGEGSLKSPYAQQFSLGSHKYKRVFIAVLTLIIVAQLAYLALTGILNTQQPIATDISIANTTQEVNDVVIVKTIELAIPATTQITQATTVSELNKPGQHNETSLAKTDSILTKTEPGETVKAPDIPPQITTTPEPAAPVKPIETSQLTKTEQASSTNKNISSAPSQNMNPADTPSIQSTTPTVPHLKNAAPQIKPENKSIISSGSDSFDAQQIIYQASIAQKNGNVNSAFRLLSKAMESEPDNLDIRLAVSKLWLNQQQPENALEIIDDLNEPEAIAFKALIFETMKNTDEAMQLYRQLAESNTLINGYQLRYAVLLENARDTKQAYIWYQRFSKNRGSRQTLRVFALERMKNITNTGQL